MKSSQRLERIAERAIAGDGPGRNDAIWLATEADFDELLFHANRLRQRAFGSRIHLCSIINAKSGACSEDCRFCAQSAHHRTGAKVYPLVAVEEIAEAARCAAASGAGCFGIVTSGEGLSAGRADFEKVCTAARIIAESGIIMPSVSVGRLGDKEVARLKAAGVRRIHHNLETSARFFGQVCTTHSHGDRVATVRAIKAAGLEACCGGLFGLGESWEDRVGLAIELRDLGVDSVPLNFLNPIAGTPLAARPLLSPREALRIIALFRFVLPTRQINICGGREVTLRDMQSWIFKAGASGMMVGGYLTTTGRPVEQDLQMLADLGLEVGSDAPPLGSGAGGATG